MSLAQGFTPFDVDMESGLPRFPEDDVERQGQEMVQVLDATRNEAAEIMASLCDPRTLPVVKVWINQLVKRMDELMKGDPFCVAIMAGFAELGFKVNYAEEFVKGEIRRVTGPNFPIPDKKKG